MYRQSPYYGGYMNDRYGMIQDSYGPYGGGYGYGPYGADGEYNRYHFSYNGYNPDGTQPSAAVERRDVFRDAEARDMYRYGGYGRYGAATAAATAATAAAT